MYAQDSLMDSRESLKTIFVCNIPEELKNRDVLKDNFSKFGSILDLQCSTDLSSCTIQYGTHEAAAKAKIGGTLCSGVKLQIFWSIKKCLPSLGNEQLHQITKIDQSSSSIMEKESDEDITHSRYKRKSRESASSFPFKFSEAEVHSSPLLFRKEKSTSPVRDFTKCPISITSTYDDVTSFSIPSNPLHTLGNIEDNGHFTTECIRKRRGAIIKLAQKRVKLCKENLRIRDRSSSREQHTSPLLRESSKRSPFTSIPKEDIKPSYEVLEELNSMTVGEEMRIVPRPRFDTDQELALQTGNYQLPLTVPRQFPILKSKLTIPSFSPPKVSDKSVKSTSSGAPTNVESRLKHLSPLRRATLILHPTVKSPIPLRPLTTVTSESSELATSLQNPKSVPFPLSAKPMTLSDSTGIAHSSALSESNLSSTLEMPIPISPLVGYISSSNTALSSSGMLTSVTSAMPLQYSAGSAQSPPSSKPSFPSPLGTRNPFSPLIDLDDISSSNSPLSILGLPSSLADYDSTSRSEDTLSTGSAHSSPISKRVLSSSLNPLRCSSPSVTLHKSVKSLSPIFEQLEVADIGPTSEDFTDIQLHSNSLWSDQDVAHLENILRLPAILNEEKLKVLEARDKLLRIKRKNSKVIAERKNIGICPDMCPEKERYQRDIHHQVDLYEYRSHTERSISHLRAVKRYTRSSADQELPLSHEMRPVYVLQLTMNYLICEIMGRADDPEENLGDWYHFLWDCTRAIRKDIIQQEICCTDSVNILEQCARFHIFCCERLVEENVSVYDEKINTENLTKCLQSLKYMYRDLRISNIICPNEAEFVAYTMFLNLNSGTFMIQYQRMPDDIQKSAPVMFVIQMYLALRDNNYVKFFRLVQSTTYLNACILHRYFPQVRAKALITMCQSYSFGKKKFHYPLKQIQKLLLFDSVEEAGEFCQNHDIIVEKKNILLQTPSKVSKSSTKYIPLKRSNAAVGCKRRTTIMEVVCNGVVPENKLPFHKVHNSFGADGILKKEAWSAEDQEIACCKMHMSSAKSEEHTLDSDVTDNLMDVVSVSTSEEAPESEFSIATCTVTSTVAVEDLSIQAKPQIDHSLVMECNRSKSEVKPLPEVKKSPLRPETFKVKISSACIEETNPLEVIHLKSTTESEIVGNSSPFQNKSHTEKMYTEGDKPYTGVSPMIKDNPFKRIDPILIQASIGLSTPRTSNFSFVRTLFDMNTVPNPTFSSLPTSEVTSHTKVPSSPILTENLPHFVTEDSSENDSITTETVEETNRESGIDLQRLPPIINLNKPETARRMSESKDIMTEFNLQDSSYFQMRNKAKRLQELNLTMKSVMYILKWKRLVKQRRELREKNEELQLERTWHLLDSRDVHMSLIECQMDLLSAGLRYWLISEKVKLEVIFKDLEPRGVIKLDYQSDLFYKLVVSLPDETEASRLSQILLKWSDYLFTNDECSMSELGSEEEVFYSPSKSQQCKILRIAREEINSVEYLTSSVMRVLGVSTNNIVKEMIGTNGILFVSTGPRLKLDRKKARLLGLINNMSHHSFVPVAIVEDRLGNELATDFKEFGDWLLKLEEEKSISSFRIFLRRDRSQVTNELVTEAISWLAYNSPKSTQCSLIPMRNLFESYGKSELWGRVRQSMHMFSMIEIVQKPSKFMCIHNESVDRLKQLILHDNIDLYAHAAPEFQSFEMLPDLKSSLIRSVVLPESLRFDQRHTFNLIQVMNMAKFKVEIILKDLKEDDFVSFYDAVREHHPELSPLFCYPYFTQCFTLTPGFEICWTYLIEILGGRLIDLALQSFSNDLLVVDKQKLDHFTSMPWYSRYLTYVGYDGDAVVEHDISVHENVAVDEASVDGSDDGSDDDSDDSDDDSDDGDGKDDEGIKHSFVNYCKISLLT